MSLSFPASPTVGQKYGNWVWNGQSWDSISGTGLGLSSTRQVFTSGSGTYTPPSNPAPGYIEVEMVGGGGGGCNGISGAGTNGGNTTFGSLTANGGSGSTTVFNAGGSATGGDINIKGGDGGKGNISDSVTLASGGYGGASYFSGGGYGTYQSATGGGAGAAGSGGGGGGTSNQAGGNGGAGGGAGGYCRKITPPVATAYSVGAGGAGAAASGVGYAGGKGGDGLIIVTEYYPGAIGPTGPQGPVGPFLRNYLDGFISVPGTTSIAFGDGQCIDSTNTVAITGPAITKTTAAFAAGNNNGGLCSGVTLAAATWYYAFAAIISGVFDIFYDSDLGAAHKPAGTTAFRRIWAFQTQSASTQILPYTQIGDDCVWAANVAEKGSVTVGTGVTVITLGSVPPIPYAKVRLTGSAAGVGATTQVTVAGYDEPSTGMGANGYTTVTAVNGQGSAWTTEVTANAARVKWTANAGATSSMATDRYTDPRGRNQ